MVLIRELIDPEGGTRKGDGFAILDMDSNACRFVVTADGAVPSPRESRCYPPNPSMCKQCA